MVNKSRNKTLAQKTSAVQWPKRSNKQPRGPQVDMEAIPPSPTANEGEEEEAQPHKPKRKRNVRSKSRRRKPQRIPSPDRARKPKRMPLIHEDDFEDIEGFHRRTPTANGKGRTI